MSGRQRLLRLLAVTLIAGSLVATSTTPAGAGGEEFMSWGTVNPPLVTPEAGGTCMITAKVWLKERGDSKVNQLKAKFHLLPPYIGTSEVPNLAKWAVANHSEGWKAVNVPNDSRDHWVNFFVRFRIPQGNREYIMLALLRGGRAGWRHTDAKLQHTFEEPLSCSPLDVAAENPVTGGLTLDPDRPTPYKPPTGITPETPQPDNGNADMGGF